MAAYGPAINRIQYLAGHRSIPQSTPNTIRDDRRTRNGPIEAIRSYGLRIAFYDSPSGDWLVKTDADNSVTTNRHIRSAHMAFSDLRQYTDVGTETINGTVWTRYQFNA